MGAPARALHAGTPMARRRTIPSVKATPGRLTSELHERLSSPLYPFAFVLVVVAFIGGAQTTRQNRMQAVIAAFCCRHVCRILGIAAANSVARATQRRLPALCRAGRRGAVRAGWHASGRSSRGRPHRWRYAARMVVGWQRAPLRKLPSARARRLQRRRGGAASRCSRRTLRRYVAKRFLLSDPGRLRRLRRADLHDRHDRAAAPVAPRDRPFDGRRCCGWGCCGCRPSPRSCWRSRFWSAASAPC